ncbi:MAG: thioesterase [Acidobacteria bacterium]|nr:MAG: thioesterase [Acidobacteriota bacterium]
MKQIAVGLKGEARRVVTPDQTAEAFGSGLVPVYATPAMVGLMEKAAVAALEGQLAPGDTTVGTKLEIAHLAATPLGDDVRAEAEVVAVDGRRLVFTLAAWDSTEKIGEGRHERVIVARDRFLARVGQKGTSGGER